MMWSWQERTTGAELLKHIDMLPYCSVEKLKQELKKRNQPVSGTKENLQTRLLNYDIRHMKHPQTIPQKFWNTINLEFDHFTEVSIEEIRKALVECSHSAPLNWTSFPEVLLDE